MTVSSEEPVPSTGSRDASRTAGSSTVTVTSSVSEMPLFVAVSRQTMGRSADPMGSTGAVNSGRATFAAEIAPPTPETRVQA